jgi:hypothetical protein
MVNRYWNALPLSASVIQLGPSTTPWGRVGHGLEVLVGVDVAGIVSVASGTVGEPSAWVSLMGRSNAGTGVSVGICGTGVVACGAGEGACDGGDGRTSGAQAVKTREARRIATQREPQTIFMRGSPKFRMRRRVMESVLDPTPNGLELSCPAKILSFENAELAGSAPASCWAATRRC